MARLESWTWHGRVMIVSLILGSLAMVGVIWWYYEREREANQAAVAGQVAAIASAKATQVASWHRERLGDGRVQASSATLKVARRILAAPDASGADRAELFAVMRQLEQEFLYTGAFLVDRTGGIRAQYPADHAAPSRLGEFARAGAVADDVKLEDLYLDARSGRPLMALNVPVTNLGALILEIDPSRYLYPYLRSWPVPSGSSETTLVRPAGNNEFLDLSDLRHRPGSALAYQQPLPPGLPSLDAVESGWQGNWLDYREVPVLGVVRRVPDTPWYLIAKIDALEVDAPVRRLGWEMALFVVLIAVANVAAVGLIWRDQQVRLHQQRESWFRAVANDTPAYLWMTFAEENNAFINTPFGKFLGTDQEILPGTWLNYLHPDDSERARAAFRECLADRRQYEMEYSIRRFDGEYRRVISQGLPRFSATGEFLGYAGSIVDITDRRQAEQQLRITNDALAAELAERTRHESEIRLLSARLMNAQEEERGRLARELHDDLSQQIAALSIAMGSLKRQIPGEQIEVRSQSDRIQQKLVQAAETVRRISHQIHPAVLEHSGLVSALQSYCEEFGSLTGIQVSVDTEGSFDRVPSAVALSLYRITQEALQNVAKHAQIGEAQVILRISEETLSLTIADLGVGMELPAVNLSGGLGLLSIKERTRLIHGTVEFSSRLNQGATVIVKVPLGDTAHAVSV
jgi:PAS domain S-box-containing protein